MSIFWSHGFIFGVWATLIPILRDQLQILPGLLGMVLLSLTVGGLIAMRLAGWLIKNFSLTRVLGLSGLFGCFMLMALLLVHNSVQLAIVLFFIGCGMGLLDQLMNAQSLVIERRSGRKIVSSFHGMWSLGTLMGSGVGAFILHFSTVQVEIIFSALLAGGLIYFSSHYLLNPSPLPVEAISPKATELELTLQQSASSAALSLGSSSSESTFHSEGSSVLTTGRMDYCSLVLVALMMALAFAVEGSLLDWAGLYLKEFYHLSNSAAGLGFTSFALVMLIGRLSGDKVRSYFPDFTVLRLALLGVVILGIGLISSSVTFTILCFALTGLAICNAAPILFALAGRIGESHGIHGEVHSIGWAASLAYAGLAGIPPLLGLVGQYFTMAGIFIVVMVFCLLIFIGTFLLPSSYNSR
ncbi:MFS transporter [Entomobacter blattae]|nr:MFS transporter [Entomobacter blattae]